MKTILALIILIVAPSNVYCQILGNPDHLCIQLFDKTIKYEIYRNIRIENIRRHLNYLEVYNRVYTDTMFCHKLKTEFIDYEDVFGFKDSLSVLPENILKQMEIKGFSIWPYNNWYYEYSKSTILKGYTFYVIHEQIFENTGIVAVNDTDFNDILFIGGNYLPIDNIYFSLEPDFKNKLPTLNDDFRNPGSVYYYVNQLNIPLHKHSLQNIIAYEHYANMLSVFFISASGRFHGVIQDFDEENNEFIVRVNVSRIDSGGRKQITFPNPKCLWIISGPLQKELIIRNCRSYRLNIPCNDFNGKVVSSMLVKFNTDTKRIQFKINDTKDISEFEECPY